MATDQKLISHLLDLSRNIEKLSGEVKKSTTATTTLVDSNTDESKKGEKDQSKILEGLKGLDFKGLKDEMSSLTKGFGNLDIKGLSEGLKNLDFKGLNDGLKNLDFKGLTETMKGIDLKGLGDLKNGLGDLKNLDVSGVAKNLISGSGAKDLVSGVLGKGAGGILGGFESGGVVKIPGNYIVGEKGREIVNLSKGSSVIPNESAEPIIAGAPSKIADKAKKPVNKEEEKKPPTAEEIGNKIKSILSANQVIGNLNIPNKKAKPDEEGDIDGSQGPIFTMQDVAKLGKPIRPSENKETNEIKAPVSPATTVNKTSKENTGKIEGSQENASAGKNSADVISKPGFLSRMLSKAKNEIGAEDGMSSLLNKGTSLLKSSGSSISGKYGNLIENGSNILQTSNNLGLSKMAMSLASRKKENVKKEEAAVIKNESPSLKTKSISNKKESENSLEMSKPNNVMSGISDIAESSKNASVAAVASNTSLGEESKKSDQSESPAPTEVDFSEMVDVLNKILNALNGPLSFSSIESPFRPDSRRV